ncbi:MAG: TolC family protein [Gemmataceae bacterium]|nr:TolC family protein [Gemmataceae bacterium]
MGKRRAFRKASWSSILVLLGFLAARTASAQSASDASLPPPRPLAPAPALAPLSLQQLVELAVQNNPDIAVARARAEAARGRLIQAGLYINPVLTWEAKDMRMQNGRAGGSQGPTVEQQVITAHKLPLAQAAASQGVAVADWQALTLWYDVITRTRIAYFEVLTAQRSVQTTEEILSVARASLEVAQKLQKAGTGTRPDVLRAQVELNQTQVQLQVAQQRLAAAWQLLAVALGTPEVPCPNLQDLLSVPAPSYDWPAVLDAVTSASSPVQEAQALALQMERQLLLVKAQRIPDVRIAVRAVYNFADPREEMTVWLGSPVPIFNRNQGNILAAEADVGRAREEVRQVELRLKERLAGAFQRYMSARQQVEAYEKEILPSARESLELIQKGYERGDPKYDYTTLLQAQQTYFQARLVYVQSQGNLWRAVSEIAGLVQQDHLSDCTQPAE